MRLEIVIRMQIEILNGIKKLPLYNIKFVGTRPFEKFRSNGEEEARLG